MKYYQTENGPISQRLNTWFLLWTFWRSIGHSTQTGVNDGRGKMQTAGAGICEGGGRVQCPLKHDTSGPGGKSAWQLSPALDSGWSQE